MFKSPLRTLGNVFGKFFTVVFDSKDQVKETLESLQEKENELSAQNSGIAAILNEMTNKGKSILEIYKEAKIK